MLNLNDAINKAKNESKLLIKVIYFNNSYEYYVHSSMPDKNEYIPDGYNGNIKLIANFNKGTYIN